MVFLAFTWQDPQAIEMQPKIPRTSKFHKVLRTYNEDNVCKM